MTTFLELLPMWALFEGSIWLAVLFERRQMRKQSSPGHLAVRG
jgi:Sec-independent protein secretion pathway component TatC